MPTIGVRDTAFRSSFAGVAEQPGMWSWRWSLPFDRRLRFPQASFLTRTSFVVSNAVATDIRAGLHLPRGVEAIVVSRSELEQ